MWNNLSFFNQGYNFHPRFQGCYFHPCFNGCNSTLSLWYCIVLLFLLLQGFIYSLMVPGWIICTVSFLFMVPSPLFNLKPWVEVELLLGYKSSSKKVGTDLLRIVVVVVVVFNAERVSHSTQAASYTHARQNRLLFANRQRGILRLRVGCANTQWTSGIFSPVPQGLG